MKNYQLNCRVDQNVMDVINDVMDENSYNKSEAVRHLANSYNKYQNHKNDNQKKRYLEFVADMTEAINGFINSGEEKKALEIINIMEEYKKCQI